MVTPESIKAGIEAGLACERVEVMGDGHVPRDDLLAILGHLRLSDLSESLPHPF